MDKYVEKTRQSYKGGNRYSEQIYINSWARIKTIVNTKNEPFLILDKNFLVITANDTFYNTFLVEEIDTENKSLFELGNGQWNVLELKRSLEDILTNETSFSGFKVSHNFPYIGHRVMVLNARKIYVKEDIVLDKFSNLILLAMEDISELMAAADTIVLQTKKSENYIEKLEREIGELRVS